MFQGKNVRPRLSLRLVGINREKTTGRRSLSNCRIRESTNCGLWYFLAKQTTPSGHLPKHVQDTVGNHQHLAANRVRFLWAFSVETEMFSLDWIIICQCHHPLLNFVTIHHYLPFPFWCGANGSCDGGHFRGERDSRVTVRGHEAHDRTHVVRGVKHRIIRGSLLSLANQKKGIYWTLVSHTVHSNILLAGQTTWGSNIRWLLSEKQKLFLCFQFKSGRHKFTCLTCNKWWQLLNCTLPKPASSTQNITQAFLHAE